MILKKLAVGPIMANCYIIGDESSKKGAVIDPGEEAHRILETIEGLGLDIRYILATHGHFDHTGGCAALKRELGAEFLIHRDDLTFIEDGRNAARRWGFDIEQPPAPDRFMADGERIEIGDISLEILHTPGHSPGSVCFFREGMVFAGDTLFRGSIGRTDLRMGSFGDLERSIKTRLYNLPDDTVVYTGHGPDTVIGAEKRHNAFVKA